MRAGLVKPRQLFTTQHKDAAQHQPGDAIGAKLGVR